MSTVLKREGGQTRTHYECPKCEAPDSPASPSSKDERSDSCDLHPTEPPQGKG
jgi:hypothetical protein